MAVWAAEQRARLDAADAQRAEHERILRGLPWPVHKWSGKPLRATLEEIDAADRGGELVPADTDFPAIVATLRSLAAEQLTTVTVEPGRLLRPANKVTGWVFLTFDGEVTDSDSRQYGLRMFQRLLLTPDGNVLEAATHRQPGDPAPRLTDLTASVVTPRKRGGASFKEYLAIRNQLLAWLRPS